MQNLDKILEGLLFLAGDGVDRGIIMEKLQVTPKQLDNAIEILKKRYDKDSGITFITYKDKLQLCGNQKFADEVSVVLNPIRERQLTRSTLEVMAIIAYKQPVTRLDVQEIRGINSDYAIQTLLNYKLIEVVGRKDAVGKPLLFGTTDEFLRHFGLNQIEELPDYDELMKSIKEIEEQNSHLYHEFDIPDEETVKEQTFTEPNENEIKDEVKTKENIELQEENKTTENKAIEQENVPVEKIDDSEIIKENVEIEEEKVLVEKDEPKEAIKEKKENKTEKRKQEKIKEVREEFDGIDYDIFGSEEQMQRTENIFEKLIKESRKKQKETIETSVDSDKDNEGIDWSILFENTDIDK